MTADNEPAVIELQREMSISHQDFQRLLPAAVPGYQLSGDGPRYQVRLPNTDRQLTIDLGPQRERRLGALCLPVTDVHFQFSGFDQAGFEAFIKRFDLAFQRGGG